MSALLLSEVTIPTIHSGCRSLVAILHKAMAHAEEHKIDEEVLLAGRLYPNMYPLSRQVQLVADLCRRAISRLQGTELPSVENKEKTFAELIALVESTMKQLEAVDRALIDERVETIIEVKMGAQGMVKLTCGKYARSFIIPNTLFHLSIAYAILRQDGVPLAKRDYLACFMVPPS